MIEFIKMHGIGNDYIYLDCIANPMPDDIEQFSRHASDRHKGIGGDGVVLILPSDIADCRMRMFNADGSEGRMCGNAIRCVGKYYYETYIAKTRDTRHETRDTRHETRNTRHETQETRHETQDTRHETRDTGHETQDTKHETRDTRHETRDNCALYIVNCELNIETLSGIKHLTLNVIDNKVESVTVDMGIPSLQPADIPILTDAPFINQTISIETRDTRHETRDARLETRDSRLETRDARHEIRDTRHETRDNCELCIVNCALAVSMGNPHLILPIDDTDNYPLHQLGPLWENHPLFPDRVNTEIVEQLSPTHLRMRVWERGSGETLACGTGACAVVVAFTHLNRVPKGEPITVSLRGGDLIITYCDNNHVLMQGTATEVFRGTINF